MTTVQKAIKYLAIAFAVFLIASIFSGIFGVLGSLGMFFGEKNPSVEMNTHFVLSDIESLKVDIPAADFEIYKGENFKVHSNREDFIIEEKNGILSVRGKNGFFKNYNNVAIKIEVPSGFVFKKADIATGAGRVNIDELRAEILELNLGAGEAEIGAIYSSVKTKIESGVGKIVISGGEMRDLDFSMGVGKVVLKSKLLGECDLDGGIGSANITLFGKQEDYEIEFESGVGQIRFDGEVVEGHQTFGNGQTDIDIDSGIGEIVVTIE